jgi:signal transduction histidine kinase
MTAFVHLPGGHSLTHVDGTVHQVRVTPFGDNGVVVVSVDVTEKTRAEERLARSERLALIGQMLAQITHEVRNPLNSLSLNAELLGDELQELDPKKKTEAWDILDLVAREIDRLTAVTGHYLQLARRPPAQRMETDVASVVEDVTRLLQPELDALGVTLTLDVPETITAVVDGSQLKQALLNVTRNAVEAGACNLSLAVSASPDLTVVLVDDGPGMTPEEAERASDPFFSTKVAGTGLGLAITKQIIEDHHGWIEVDSSLGKGTRISLMIPMAEVNASDPVGRVR